MKSRTGELPPCVSYKKDFLNTKFQTCTSQQMTKFKIYEPHLPTEGPEQIKPDPREQEQRGEHSSSLFSGVANIVKSVLGNQYHPQQHEKKNQQPMSNEWSTMDQGHLFPHSISPTGGSRSIVEEQKWPEPVYDDARNTESRKKSDVKRKVAAKKKVSLKKNSVKEKRKSSTVASVKKVKPRSTKKDKKPASNKRRPASVKR
jgi:hypothetical protein